MVTKDNVIMALTFISAVLALAATQSFVTDQLKPYLLFAVGVVNLALTVFFGVVKPIATAFVNGRAAARAELNSK